MWRALFFTVPLMSVKHSETVVLSIARMPISKEAKLSLTAAVSCMHGVKTGC